MRITLFWQAVGFVTTASLMLGAGIACGAADAKPTSPPGIVLESTATQIPPPTDTLAHSTTEPASLPTQTRELTPVPAPTEAPIAASATVLSPTDTRLPMATQTAMPAIAVGLQGLALDEFFDESYRRLLLRKPEQITAIGIAERFGLRNDQLNDLSDAYVRETQKLEAAILDLLRAYDRAALSPEQQLSYDVYEWYLDNRVRGHLFMYHDYPLHHFLGSYHGELLLLFTETHPLDSIQDAEDYVSRLAQVDRQVGQLIEGLRLRESAGVVPPKFVLQMTHNALMDLLGITRGDTARINPQSLAVYAVFREKLANVDGLSAEASALLLDAAMDAVNTSFIPAFTELLKFVDDQLTRATDDAGVWKLPDGDAYYAYVLRDQNSTDLTAEEIHQMGLAEVERIQSEMRQVFNELGYPQDAGLEELIGRAIQDAGFFDTSSQAGKRRLIEAYESIIMEAEERVDIAFDIRPQAKVVVVGGPDGGYYVPGSADGSRPGAYHVATEGTWAAKMFMAPVAYHEAVPGHHTQIAIAQELNLPLFRSDLFFNGYSEGWALYAEQLAWELGLYENDAYGNIGRLRLELMRAARLAADTGIHSLGWSRQGANDFMSEAMGAPPGAFSHEVDRYIVRPAQATGYKVGMIKILELRQRAMDALGEQFDLSAFHSVVLTNGGVPLGILESLVDEYIMREARGGTGN